MPESDRVAQGLLAAGTALAKSSLSPFLNA
jgi:hypothetical protein